LKDYRFFKASGGGVTITGGEPLSQPVAAERLAAEIKKVGLSLAIETCGYAAWENAKKVFEHCDQILFDIKEIDPAKHKKFTGVDNALILSNARKAAKMDSQFVVRFPLIGGYNDTDENVLATAKFAAEIGADQVHLLPFHRFGENKYEKSNMIYDCDAYTPTDEQINRFMDMMREYGLDVKQGG
jgi:pyruvate formate lyase activating enzyme